MVVPPKINCPMGHAVLNAEDLKIPTLWGGDENILRGKALRIFPHFDGVPGSLCMKCKKVAAAESDQQLSSTFDTTVVIILARIDIIEEILVSKLQSKGIFVERPAGSISPKVEENPEDPYLAKASVACRDIDSDDLVGF
ncbi:hypothetical protein B0H13DRAFT_1871038 [Mycena leptocephala]|nr:hypothetical protein B0H13DRAFT_1871038 [Mycena leptocephala]